MRQKVTNSGLNHVNYCLVKERVKLEDWKFGFSYFTKGSYMFSFDFKSGYHHVEISREHQTCLVFSWKVTDSGDEIIYAFTFFSFGLSTTLYVFTKLVKPLGKPWRLQGICVAIFLANGCGIVRDRQGFGKKFGFFYQLNSFNWSCRW